MLKISKGCVIGVSIGAKTQNKAEAKFTAFKEILAKNFPEPMKNINPEVFGEPKRNKTPDLGPFQLNR